MQLTAGIYYLLDQQKQQIEAVIRDKSPVRFEIKRRQAETSYEEKITTSREHLDIEKTPYNSNSITPTNLPRENRDLLENSMQKTPAELEPSIFT